MNQVAGGAGGAGWTVASVTTGGVPVPPRRSAAIPAARDTATSSGVRAPGPTRGEGELESAFAHYAPVTRGTPPRCPRTDHTPLNRKEYLLNVTRRVAG